jgi:Tfp pilus assembly protein PilF
MAHVGGLASGALLAFVNLRVLGKVDKEVFAEDPQERLHALQQQALSLMESLDMNGAREVLKQILELDPDNRSALQRLYQIEKLHPESQAFHETASRLLRHMSSGKGDAEDLYKTYKDYFQTSGNPRINLELLFRMSNAFGLSGHLEESEKMMVLALKKAPKSDKLPSSLLALARSHIEKGMREKGRQWLQVVSTRFPETNEARIAQGLLKSSGTR